MAVPPDLGAGRCDGVLPVPGWHLLAPAGTGLCVVLGLLWGLKLVHSPPKRLDVSLRWVQHPQG